jgi:hypothetical protein
MTAMSPYASNNHGVRTRPLDFAAEGATTSKTYHAISIVVQGRVVGRIQSWQANAYNRNGKHIYELSHHTFGRAIDYVPGINSAYSLTFSRAEVWNQEIEIVLGYPGIWQDLIDQDRPFTCQEHLFKGRTPYRIWTYSGCWFTDRNENQFEAEANDATIMVNCTANFVSRRRTL